MPVHGSKPRTRPAPMLARLARALPVGELSYEPKWDGFRCLAVREGAHIELWSRNDRPLARYFPELVGALRALSVDDVQLDGEIVVVTDNGPDFDALLKRIHPAARRVEEMAARAPARLILFDALCIGGDDLLAKPFVERRRALEALLSDAAEPLALSPATEEVDTAQRWLNDAPPGIDGVVAKDRRGAYEPGKRGWIKVKPEHTAECIVAGCRLALDRPAVASLLLGLYDDAGVLRHVGVVSSFTETRRHELLHELAPYVVELDEHPWSAGFAREGGSMGRLPGSAGRWEPGMELDWVPLRPELVCEVAYDQVGAGRWRHPGRFLRWRPDRDARSCTLDQLGVA